MFAITNGAGLVIGIMPRCPSKAMLTKYFANTGLGREVEVYELFCDIPPVGTMINAAPKNEPHEYTQGFLAGLKEAEKKDDC